MIRLHLLALSVAFAIPALAETPPPAGPPELPRVDLPASDNDPAAPFDQPAWMPCCMRDGTILPHTEGWLKLLHGKAKAQRITHAHCAALDVTTVPACKTWRAK